MKRQILTAAVLLAGAAASAQNLNPTVEVTRSYEGKIVEADKKAVAMDVPDSLLHFDLDFGYSVFETKYGGAGDFSPYLMDMKPAQTTGRKGQLYVRAGAGYSLRPQLEAVFSPEVKGAWDIDIYASHRSYFGKYHSFGSRTGTDGFYTLSSASSDAAYLNAGKGYDSRTLAGVSGRSLFSGGEFSFNAGYYGLHTSDPYLDHFSTGLNSASLQLRIRNAEQDGSYFAYDASVSVRKGADKYSADNASIAADGGDRTGVGYYAFDGAFGPVMGSYNRIEVGVHAGLHTYSDILDGTIGTFWAAPHYMFEKNGMQIKLGAKIGGAFKNTDDPDAGTSYFGNTTGQIIYPDLALHFNAVPGRLSLFATVTGGIDENTYFSLKEDRHFLNFLYGRNLSPVIDNSVESINITAGAEGNIASKLKYSLKGGFAVIKNGLLDMAAVGAYDINTPLSWYHSYNWMTGITYQDYEMFHADFAWAYDSRNVLVDGSLNFKSTSVYKDGSLGFQPAPLSGNMRAVYNWNGRISGGIYADFATARKGYVSYGISQISAKIPGWLDLGLTGEYALRKDLSVWARASNLLGSTVQRMPFIAEKGISLTGGIIFTL